MPEDVVLPSPAVGQELGCSLRDDELIVEELIHEPAVEQLSHAVLPWGAWFHVDRSAAVIARNDYTLLLFKPRSSTSLVWNHSL